VEELVAEADVVVHMAAETHVPRSIHDNVVFVETDVFGTQVLLNAVLKRRGALRPSRPPRCTGRPWRRP
jgi:dTDP-glucose 4,6-dehydratase